MDSFPLAGSHLSVGGATQPSHNRGRIPELPSAGADYPSTEELVSSTRQSGGPPDPPPLRQGWPVHSPQRLLATVRPSPWDAVVRHRRTGLTFPQHEPASRRLTSRSGQRHRSRASSRHAFAAACADFTDIPATPPHGSNLGDAVIAVHPEQPCTVGGAKQPARPEALGHLPSRQREAASAAWKNTLAATPGD